MLLPLTPGNGAPFTTYYHPLKVRYTTIPVEVFNQGGKALVSKECLT